MMARKARAIAVAKRAESAAPAWLTLLALALAVLLASPSIEGAVQLSAI
jgi:hypothetical protein